MAVKKDRYIYSKRKNGGSSKSVSHFFRLSNSDLLFLAQSPPEMQNLMKNCWVMEPKERINFDSICSFLKEISLKYHSPQLSIIQQVLVEQGYVKSSMVKMKSKLTFLKYSILMSTSLEPRPRVPRSLLLYMGGWVQRQSSKHSYFYDSYCDQWAPIPKLNLEDNLSYCRVAFADNVSLPIFPQHNT